jgi:uncharacterized membrane protein (DUF106 family)
MNGEEVIALAQLLTSFKEAVSKLEESYKEKDIAEVQRAKREIMGFQKEIDKLL